MVQRSAYRWHGTYYLLPFDANPTLPPFRGKEGLEVWFDVVKSSLTLKPSLWPPEHGTFTKLTIIVDLDRSIKTINSSQHFDFDDCPISLPRKPLQSRPEFIRLYEEHTPAIQVVDRPDWYRKVPSHYFLARMLRDFCFNWRWSFCLVSSYEPHDLQFRALAHALVMLATIRNIKFKEVTANKRHTAFRTEGRDPGWLERVPAGTDYLHSTPLGDVRIVLESRLNDDQHLHEIIGKLLFEERKGAILIVSIIHIVVLQIASCRIYHTNALPLMTTNWDPPEPGDFWSLKTAELTPGILALVRVLSPPRPIIRFDLPEDINCIIDSFRFENRCVQLRDNLEIEVGCEPLCLFGFLGDRRVSISRLFRNIPNDAIAVEAIMYDVPLGVGYKFKEVCD
ncbi:hypothetical protein BDD12DRAFT_459458 [Trichophaea hybrida]|nr:hypothetical protein BDD12DRAFT_459458 [Trichophaea hybrida]